MTFLNNILGYRDFHKSMEIDKYISSQYEHVEQDAFSNVATLIFFKSKRQQTWLCVSKNHLYCILDDITNDNLVVRWKMDRSEIIVENNVNLKINIDPAYRETTGLISFSEKHRNWLYSKKMFPYPNLLRESILALIKSMMADNEWPH